MQSDMSLSNDTFIATISNQDAILRDLKFHIRVVPLVRRQEAFSVTENKMALTQKHLDASHLAGLTNSNPIYFLTETPNNGKIMRIVRTSSVTAVNNVDKRSVRDREVWQFTHEDVKNGVIYFVIAESKKFTTAHLNDSFTYRLEAPGVQPANGLFDFVIKARNGQAATKTISNPITEDVTGTMGHGNNDESVPSEIVIIISAIFIVILILIVVVFGIRFKRARDAARTKCTAPNNTKLNGDTTMTPPSAAIAAAGIGSGANGNGNPYGTIQRCGSSMRRPINNGFATLEQHPHNTLR